MKKLVDLLKEWVSETEFGSDIHFILESKESVDSFAQSLLEHLIKIVMTRHPDNVDVNGWIVTLEKSCLNIAKQKWFRESSNKEAKLKFLLKPLEIFSLLYTSARKDYYTKKEVNRFKFPETYTDSQKTIIEHYYIQIVRALAGLDSKVDLNDLGKYIKESIKTR